jgi:hypothetical protein
MVLGSVLLLPLPPARNVGHWPGDQAWVERKEDNGDRQESKGNCHLKAKRIALTQNSKGCGWDLLFSISSFSCLGWKWDGARRPC